MLANTINSFSQIYNKQAICTRIYQSARTGRHVYFERTKLTFLGGVVLASPVGTLLSLVTLTLTGYKNHGADNCALYKA